MMRHFSLCDSTPCEYDNCISLGLAHRRVYLWRQGVNCVRTDRTSARRVLSSSIRRCGLMALVLGLGAAHASAQLVQNQTLTASDAAAGKALGISVSVSGDTTVVGAMRDASGSFVPGFMIFAVGAWFLIIAGVLMPKTSVKDRV
ncbi:MAG: FG-GAP repeat protein [Planctomycetes bacterium]|nr:FG-GAP repeat protein [Planctomycetota bacterium]